MSGIKKYMPVAAVFLFALLVRIIYNITVAHGYIPEYDAHQYNDIALNLIKEHCYCLKPGIQSLDRPPLWPYIIAAIYTIMGPENFYPRLFFCFTGAATCVIVYLFARDIFNKRVALLAGIIAIVYPGLFIYDGWLYTESLFTFCLMAFCYSLYRLQRTAQAGWLVVSSVALVCASLTRPNGSLVLLLVVAWAVIIARAKIFSWRQATTSVLVIMLLTFGLIAPWTLRNYRISHQFIFVSTDSGTTLTGAYNDTALFSAPDRGLWVGPARVEPLAARNISYTPTWIREHLSSMPYLIGLHFINMWRPYTSEEGLPVREFPDRPASQVVWTMMQITPIPLFLFAAIGIIVTRKKWQHLLLPYLSILLTIIQCLIFYGSSRFRAPIEPMLVLLAAGAIWWLTQNEPGTLRWKRTRLIKKSGDEQLATS